MKTYYRKAPGCFIYTDVYRQPSRFNRGSFLIACLSACALACVLSTLF